MTDPTGVSGWVYDKDGRTATQIDQQGRHLSTSYDAASQVTTMTLPTRRAIDYTYDAAGKVTSQSSPWGTLAYTWDPVGNLTGMSRSSGVMSVFEYDADNRVTSVLHQTPQAAASAPTPTPTPVAYASGDATAEKCATVAGYLADRTTPGAGFNNLCQHTDAYLGDRTLSTPANPVADGGSLGYAYEYDKDGNLTQATRTVTAAPDAASVVPPVPSTPTPSTPSPGGTFTKAAASGAATTVSTVDYAYDGLDRLATSSTSAGEKNAYTYDAAGNRAGWARTGSADGDFTQAATFNDANQVTRTATTGAGRGVSAGIASYGYDGAGNRTSQSVAGVGTQYAYDATGQTTSVSRDGRTTSYAYDGLGRQATSTDTTAYGTESTHNSYDGTALAQSTSSTQGTTTLVRDALGFLAEHVTDTGEATWDLLDGLASTIAGGTGSSITQLASYDDWGAQTFETGGWDAPENYTGHAQDPTQGLIHTYARTYDPATGSWTSPDTWRGLLTQPKSLARYQYVYNNPTTYMDPDGHRIGDPSAYNTGDADQAKKMRDVDNASNYEIAKNRAKTFGYEPPEKPRATGPNDENDVSARHLDWWDVAGIAWKTQFDQFMRSIQAMHDWARSDAGGITAGILSWISVGAGVAGLILDATVVGAPVGIALAVASALTGVAATVISCLADLASWDCGFGAATSVLGLSLLGRVGRVLDDLWTAIKALDVLGTAAGIATGLGDLLGRKR